MQKSVQDLMKKIGIKELFTVPHGKLFLWVSGAGKSGGYCSSDSCVGGWYFCFFGEIVCGGEIGMAREMKDSGIEWIGEIPTEWEERRI